MFNWRKIQEMLKLKDFLIQVIERHTEISMEERGNLLGECDLITSFLMYNDISKMSHFHRSASRQMSRPAISIRNDGGWTFGSPSVLMMFHREPGSLLKEQEEMNECMPHYYKITNGHGQGQNGSWMQRHCLSRGVCQMPRSLWKEPMPGSRKMVRNVWHCAAIFCPGGCRCV